MDFHNDSDCSSFLYPYPWTEPSQDHWDWTTSDPLAGAAATPSYAYPPPASETALELPQTSWVSQIPRDQETANPSFYDIPDTDYTPIVDVGVEPNVTESSSNQRPTRKQPNDPAKRRVRKSKKSDRLDVIRVIMNMGHGASELEVLDAAIQHLGGVVPQLASPANQGQRMRLVYEVLHERTGSQGRLRHVQCLELVIKALQGLPTLDPIFVGQPSGST